MGNSPYFHVLRLNILGIYARTKHHEIAITLHRLSGLLSETCHFSGNMPMHAAEEKEIRHFE